MTKSSKKPNRSGNPKKLCELKCGRVRYCASPLCKTCLDDLSDRGEKYCVRCTCIRPIDDFYWSDKRNGRRAPACKYCVAHSPPCIGCNNPTKTQSPICSTCASGLLDDGFIYCYGCSTIKSAELFRTQMPGKKYRKCKDCMAKEKRWRLCAEGCGEYCDTLSPRCTKCRLDMAARGVKVCTQKGCPFKLTPQPLDSFHAKASSIDGRVDRCKYCVRDSGLKRTYGISLATFQEMLDSQGGVCAICKGRFQDHRKSLAVDHDHACQAGHDPKKGCQECIRQLLCSRCNFIQGFFIDPTEVDSHIKYAIKHGVFASTATGEML